MPEPQDQDAAIVQAAYADRVTDAFRVFAENLGMGQSEHSCTERFVRTMQIIRKARDLALVALTVDPSAAGAEAEAAAAATKATEPGGMEALSEEDQRMIEQALSGTTGTRPPPPPSPIRR